MKDLGEAGRGGRESRGGGGEYLQILVLKRGREGEYYLIISGPSDEIRGEAEREKEWF